MRGGDEELVAGTCDLVVEVEDLVLEVEDLVLVVEDASKEMAKQHWRGREATYPRSRVVCAMPCPLGESATVPARGCADAEVGVKKMSGW